MYPAKEDCFAYTKLGRCNALNCMVCSTKGNCPFYKPASENPRHKIETDIIVYCNAKLNKEYYMRTKGGYKEWQGEYLP